MRRCDAFFLFSVRFYVNRHNFLYLCSAIYRRGDSIEFAVVIRALSLLGMIHLLLELLKSFNPEGNLYKPASKVMASVNFTIGTGPAWKLRPKSSLSLWAQQAEVYRVGG